MCIMFIVLLGAAINTTNTDKAKSIRLCIAVYQVSFDDSLSMKKTKTKQNFIISYKFASVECVRSETDTALQHP